MSLRQLLPTVPCSTGYVSKTGLEPCFPCPRGYFQPQIGQSSCFLCPNNGKTDTTGSKTMLACDSVKEDKLAQYSSVPTSELIMNDCFRGPCMNDAKCVSLTVGYKCHCTPGYIGTSRDVVRHTTLSPSPGLIWVDPILLNLCCDFERSYNISPFSNVLFLNSSSMS